jgi:hypothetical protein
MLNKKTDILLNVAVPLCLGVICYLFPVSKLLRNYAADGLWAYAATSAMLIIWNRHINLLWLTTLALCFPAFEILQSLAVVKGTGDVWDIVTYLAFFSIAIIKGRLINYKYKFKFQKV